MKTKLFLISTAVLMVGCANMGTTSEKMTQLTSNLKYSEQPSKEDIIKNASSLIKPALKDPDSLKNLTITQTDKCTLAEQNLSGNITPRYSYGQWCFQLAYQATNSYGGYMPGKEFLLYSDELGYSLLNVSHGMIVSHNLSFRYDVSNPFLLPPSKQQ
jgi:hypothetical protein